MEKVNTNMGIYDILSLLNDDRETAYDMLNKILWSLQEMGAVDFHEDALDRVYNEPDY